MKWEELIARERTQRAKPTDEEHRTQVACVRWFRLAHPTLAPLLFAIPNGGRRDAATGARLRDEGVVAGVADLFLAAANSACHGLFIEMKTRTGRQQPSQRDFEQSVTAQGYQYSLCRSLDEFMRVVQEYLTNT